jgi:hypothetical protein
MPDKREETEIFNRFTAIVKTKFTNSNINQLDELYKRPEFASEKRILNEMNSIGLSKGMLSGLACFAFLRISPRLISNYLRRRVAGGGGINNSSASKNPFQQSSSSSGYKFDSFPASSQNEERPGLIFRGVRLMLDTFVSMSIGAYASIYFTDTNKMMEKFEKIPLVEGRSLLSEQLCHDFTKEFKSYGKQFWNIGHHAMTTDNSDDNRGGDEGGEFRELIQGFVANCRRREIYEKDIRQEQGLGANDEVIVPSPGVPQDIPVTLDDLFSTKDFSDNVDGDDANNGDDFFDTYFDDSSDGEGEKSFKD